MNFQATLQLGRSVERITNMKFRIWKAWHKLKPINKRVKVFKRCYFWNFVIDHPFLRWFEIILWFTFMFWSSILRVFIQSMKIEFNWTFFTLFFEVLWRHLCLFCKVNKTKTTRGLPCFLIEFNRIERWKTWVCLKVFWITIKYWNVLKFKLLKSY